MSLLILQIVIKQRDKAQRTATHVLQRANTPDTYPVTFPSAFYVFDKQYIIDQHGDDIQGNRQNMPWARMTIYILIDFESKKIITFSPIMTLSQISPPE